MVTLTGNIIVLSGASCSGKTSIATVFQALADEPYVHVGIDHFEAMQPQIDGQRLHMFYGQRKDRTADPDIDLVHVAHICIAAFADAGANVIAEHIFLKRRWLKDIVGRLRAYPVLFVGVFCPLDELIRHEQEREVQVPSSGQAARQFRKLEPLNTYAPYDLVVNTAELSSEECVRRISSRLETGPAPTAFRRLYDSAFLDERDRPLA
jgi:chloramphenicol 3-O-phosphotransferase